MGKHRRRRRSGGVDRISDLPDDLLGRILSFLPTRNEVATSILATRWKFLWTKVPALYFEDNTTRYYWVSKNREEGEEMAFGPAADKVLLERDARPLEKFSLSWSYVDEVASVNKWVNCAIARGVRDLRLDLFSQTFDDAFRVAQRSSHTNPATASNTLEQFGDSTDHIRSPLVPVIHRRDPCT